MKKRVMQIWYIEAFVQMFSLPQPLLLKTPRLSSRHSDDVKIWEDSGLEVEEKWLLRNFSSTLPFLHESIECT